MFWRKRHAVSDEELSAFVDGELAAARAAFVESHVAACPACRGALEELRAVKSMLAALPRVAPARSFTLSRELAALPASPRATGRWPSPALAPAAALALFVAILGADLYTAPGQSADQAARDGKGTTALSQAAETGEAGADGGLPEAAGPTTAMAPPAPEAAADSAAGAPAPDASAAGDDAAATAPAATEELRAAEPAATADDESSRLAWRVAEVLALVAIVGSLIIVWRLKAAT